MRFIYKILLFSTLSMLFTGCFSLSSLNPFNSSKTEAKEGYLTIDKINKNSLMQMPLEHKVGTDSIRILNVKIFSEANRSSLIVEADFIFTSFEIPEGLPAIARFDSSLKYIPATKEFKLDNLKLKEIRFLKEQLIEYISPKQKIFIKNALISELKELVLHKSNEQFTTIESFETEDGKIKVKFK